MPYDATSAQDSLMREVVSDLAYFVPSRKKRFIAERSLLWEKHVNTFAHIKHGEDSGPADWKLTRMDFLANHLDILDRKFSVLLQFQGLLGVVISILIGTLKSSLLADQATVILFSLFIVIWFVTTFICLRGVGRVRWGDLWKPTDALNAESEHVHMLIHVIVRRTAKFRLAIFLAFTNGAVLIILMAIIGLRAF